MGSDEVEHQNNGKQEQIEDPSQRQYQAHKTGHVTCQACAQPLPDGTGVTAYAVRLCPHSPWMVAKTCCGDHSLTLADHTTLGVDERVMSGRVARVVDQVHQRSWPITIAEDPITTASPHTTIPREVQA